RLRHVGHDYGETENAAHIATQSRPTSHRNQRPTSNGITGPLGPEYAEDDVQQMKDMAISLPFLVLDEANNVKKLTNLLKAVGTGAMDSRRELYTTAKMRYTPYQARIWMTANTASLTNETISSRMLIIDAAPRTEAEPFRSEHYLEWTQEKRNEIWTELIGRLAMAMHSLQEADKVGEGDLCVSHRMSSFWVLGRAIARQEGYEDRLLNAMQQMTLRQQGASVEGSELIDLIKMLPRSYAGKPLTAGGWAKLLSVVVPERNRELLAKVSRKNWVPMAVTKTDLDAVVEEWLAAQDGFKRYVNATEKLYAAFTEGWCGPRRGLPDAFADFRAALLSECDHRNIEVSEVRPSRHIEIE
ncbi:MAG TPA: hypothetical protein VMW15_08515, partial [Terracidiphilus sp.]|nr:hypothetical protein [Terracidiphilus sp.]